MANDNQPLFSHITPIYLSPDALSAPEGHFPILKTDIECIFYRNGNGLVLIVQKAGVCVYKCILRNAFDRFRPELNPSADPLHDNIVIRSIPHKEEVAL